MADEMNGPWEKEPIPDEATLFMRVHKNLMDNGRPMPGAFRNHPDRTTDGMSTDWKKYSSPQRTRSTARKPPSEYAVIQLNVGDVRQVPRQTVEHTPIYQPESDPPEINRAHTDVFGDKGDIPNKKNPEIRLKFRAICKVIIALEDPV